jgi:hypothetical protein
MLALLRPGSWDFPLFLHVLGAVVLVGAVAASAIAAGRAGASLVLRRVLVGTLAAVALPAWLLMRIAGQWIESKWDFDEDPAWVGVGYTVAEPGLVILLVATIAAWWGVRRPEKRWPVQTAAVLTTVYVAALLVAMWAMTAKPD